jgi:putative ABC transport system ATP-binding protein
MTAAVSLANVVKRYRRGRESVEVLHGLNLDIAEGEFVAIMGPSGSGKSTVLNLIGGLDRPDAGTVVVAGERIDRLSGGALTRWRAGHVGFVFQFYNLMPALSAAANVELPLLLLPLSRSRRRAKVGAALEIVGLEDRARHKPSELSGGQQQRVSLARALVAHPAIVWADEPTGNLDEQNSHQVVQLLRHLNGAYQQTIVMVTHDSTVASACDRTLRMEDGRFVP